MRVLQERTTPCRNQKSQLWLLPTYTNKRGGLWSLQLPGRGAQHYFAWKKKKGLPRAFTMVTPSQQSRPRTG